LESKQVCTHAKNGKPLNDSFGDSAGTVWLLAGSDGSLRQGSCVGWYQAHLCWERDMYLSCEATLVMLW